MQLEHRHGWSGRSMCCTHPSVSNTCDCNALFVCKHQSPALCSKTFDCGCLFVYPPSHTQMKVTLGENGSAQSFNLLWRKSNCLEWMDVVGIDWYAQHRRRAVGPPVLANPFWTFGQSISVCHSPEGWVPRPRKNRAPKGGRPKHFAFFFPLSPPSFALFVSLSVR